MIPNTLEELFDNRDCEYSYINYDTDPMDNNESMDFFLSEVCADNENIESNEGTQVILAHKDYPYKLQVDAYGLGDFFSHGFSVSII